MKEDARYILGLDERTGFGFRCENAKKRECPVEVWRGAGGGLRGKRVCKGHQTFMFVADDGHVCVAIGSKKGSGFYSAGIGRRPKGNTETIWAANAKLRPFDGAQFDGAQFDGGPCIWKQA